MQQQQAIVRRARKTSRLTAASLLLLFCLAPARPGAARGTGVDAMCMVKEHNVLRDAVGVPELRWSKALARQAAAWAGKLKNAGCAMQHSHGRLGENLYWASPLRTTARSKNGVWRSRLTLQAVKEANVVAGWASEKPWYSHAANTCDAPPGKSCGHYTQMVWEATREVGCAKAVCSDHSQVWVCNYAPAGNVVGQRPY